MALRTVVISRLLQIAESFDVDVIEVIGHTDEQPVVNRVSNLDRHLSSVTLRGTDAGVLQWADNVGLGRARWRWSRRWPPTPGSGPFASCRYRAPNSLIPTADSPLQPTGQ